MATEAVMPFQVQHTLVKSCPINRYVTSAHRPSCCFFKYNLHFVLCGALQFEVCVCDVLTISPMRDNHPSTTLPP